MSRSPAIIDLETTGLDYQNDAILEFAMVLCDADLNIVADFGNRVLSTTLEKHSRMVPFVQQMHTDNNLLNEVAMSNLTIEQVDAEVAQYLADRGFTASDNPDDRDLILMGSSCRLDLNMVELHMPQLMRFLHYRMIDISGAEETLGLLAPGSLDYATHRTDQFPDLPTHRAHPDVLRTHQEALTMKSALQSLRPPF